MEDLTVNLTDTSPSTLNFWMTKFVAEVVNKAGGRYPPRTLHVIVCGINRHLQEVKAENGINIMNKSDPRFTTSRRALQYWTWRREKRLSWELTRNENGTKGEYNRRRRGQTLGAAVTGGKSAESLVDTLLFYNGKLFGLRSNEHRMLRVSNMKVSNNLIVFDEIVSKTFHGSLKDLKKDSRYIEHVCHKVGEFHSPYLQSMYALYLDKVKDIALTVETFYFRPNRDGSMGYDSKRIQ